MERRLADGTAIITRQGITSAQHEAAATGTLKMLLVLTDLGKEAEEYISLICREDLTVTLKDQCSQTCQSKRGDSAGRHDDGGGGIGPGHPGSR